MSTSESITPQAEPVKEECRYCGWKQLDETAIFFSATATEDCECWQAERDRKQKKERLERWAAWREQTAKEQAEAKAKEDLDLARHEGEREQLDHDREKRRRERWKWEQQDAEHNGHESGESLDDVDEDSLRLKLLPHTEPLDGEPQPKLPAVLTRSDGETLIYEGRFNSIHGAPGEGKTWVSLFAVVEAIRQGSRVAIWDFEDRASTTATRLRAIGAVDVLDHADTELVYVRPSLAEDAKAQAALIRILQGGERTGLVVIDAAESSGAPSDGKDAMPWIREYVTPWIQAGLTVIVIDHVAKQKIDRPRGQIGSQRKLAQVDGAALYVAGAPWSKSTGGQVKLRNDKDRPGDLPARMGKWAATIIGKWVEGVLTYTIDAPDDGEENEEDKSMELLEAIAESGAQGVRTKRAIRGLVKAKGQRVDIWLEDLIQSGWVVVGKDGKTNVYVVTPDGELILHPD